GRSLFDFIATFLAQLLVQFLDERFGALRSFDFLVDETVRRLYMFNRIVDVLPHLIESGTHTFIPGPAYILAIGHIKVSVAVSRIALQHTRREVGHDG